MAAGLTKKLVTEMMEDAAGDMRTFHAQPFTNYTGRAPDTGEAYQDIVAAWCLENWPLFEDISSISRVLPYRDELRDGTRPRRLSLAEDLLARDLYVRCHPGTGRRLNIIGEILDYLMPLGNKASEHAGKVDLVAWDGEDLRLLRLRTQGSTDTMLRCLLESYTALRTVDTSKLLSDFHLPADAAVSASPFTYLNGHQKEDLSAHAASLHRLILMSGCRPIYYVP